MNIFVSVPILLLFNNFSEESIRIEEKWQNNYYSDYPYIVIENKYLCRNNTNISAVAFGNPNGIFNNPEGIREEFSNHSTEWQMLNIMLIILNFIFAIMPLIYFLASGIKYPKFMREYGAQWLFNLPYIYEIVNYYLCFILHSYLTRGFLHSVIIIFNFGDCITSINTQQYEMIYILKSWGIYIFWLGIPLVFLIYLPRLCCTILYYQELEYIYNIRKLIKIGGVIFILDIFVTSEFISRLLYLNTFVDAYHTHINLYWMNYLIVPAFVLKIIISFLGYLSLMKAYYEKVLNHNRRRRIFEIVHNSSRIDLMPNSGDQGFKIDADSYRMENNYCAICLEIMKKDVVMSCLCSHKFHSKCLNKWIRNTPTCPQCRIQIQINDIIFI